MKNRCKNRESIEQNNTRLWVFLIILNFDRAYKKTLITVNFFQFQNCSAEAVSYTCSYNLMINKLTGVWY
jgi:hypothetical protein